MKRDERNRCPPTSTLLFHLSLRRWTWESTANIIFLFSGEVTLLGARPRFTKIFRFCFRSLVSSNVLTGNVGFLRREGNRDEAEMKWLRGNNHSTLLFIAHSSQFYWHNLYEIEASRLESNRPDPSQNRIDAAPGNCSLRNVCVRHEYYHLCCYQQQHPVRWRSIEATSIVENVKS